MGKGRLEAFSDGVIAVIITIMVLELKVPHGSSLEALLPVLPVFLTYVLSFIYTAIYWNNHHHMFLTVKEISGAILWANSHLLFWLSIVPFTTAWASENHFAAIPTALYGIVLFMAGIAYAILQRAIVALQGPESILATAVGGDFKGKISPMLCFVGVVLALAHFPTLAAALYIGVAILWLVPDRRIERTLATKRAAEHNGKAAPDGDEQEEGEKEAESPVVASKAPAIDNRDITETDL